MYVCMCVFTCVGYTQGSRNHLSVMTSVFDSLLKYITNLLKSKRPSAWRSIKTNIAWFENRVDCVKGARDILKMAGYCVETEEALEFPPEVYEPNKEKLCVLAAELLMAKLEAEMLSSNDTSTSTSTAVAEQSPPMLHHAPRPGDTQRMYGSPHQQVRDMTGNIVDDRRHEVGSMGRVSAESYGGRSGSMSGGYDGASHSPQTLRAGGVNNAQPLRAGGGGVNYTQPLRAGGVNGAGGLGVNYTQPLRAGGDVAPLRAGGVNSTHSLGAGGVNAPPLRAGGVNDVMPHSVNSAMPQGASGMPLGTGAGGWTGATSQPPRAGGGGAHGVGMAHGGGVAHGVGVGGGVAHGGSKSVRFAQQGVVQHSDNSDHVTSYGSSDPQDRWHTASPG